MKKRLKEEHVFLALVCLVFILGAYTLIKNPKKTSTVENRNLTQFSHFTINAFLNGKFQDNFDKALADQFPMSEKIRINYGNVVAKLLEIVPNDDICKNRYTSLANDSAGNYRLFNCEDYIVRMPHLPNQKQLEVLESNIAKFNHVNSLIKTYYYIINTPLTFDFEKNENIFDFSEALKEKMSGDFDVATLKYDNFEQYKDYFYKTDHHWNYKGSYQGFLDITNMLDVKNPSKPSGTFSNHECFFGTAAKNVRRFEDLDEFTVYKYDIPEHEIFINGQQKQQYNHIDDFISHNYEYSQLYTFYQNVYGTSYGEIIFDFHNPEKKNLLIITDSFGHPVKELVAQYFNHTHIVDLRHYQDEMKKPFVFSKYINENKIDEVLFIASSEFFLLDNTTTEGLDK